VGHLVAGRGWLVKERVVPGVVLCGDVVGVGLPGTAVACVPELCPGLGVGGCLRGEEVVHGLGPPGQHGEQFVALGLVQAVGAGEQAHPAGGVAALVARVGAERHEAVQGVGEVPEP
jgi:hypothetical protein